MNPALMLLDFVARGALKSPLLMLAAKSHLDAWNRHDVDALLKQIGDGSFDDPLTTVPLSGPALREHVAMLLQAFPDLRFELTAPVTVGANSVSAQFELCGTHDGDLPGQLGFDAVPPTGRKIQVPGSICIAFTGLNRISAVNVYYDQHALAAALDFQAYIMPHQMGDFDFGAWYRLNKGNRNPPEAIGMTWLLSKNREEFDSATSVVKEMLEDFADKPGFVTGIIGAKSPDAHGESAGFTLTAWENLEAMDQILADPGHQVIVQKFMREGYTYATHSRVYKLERSKPVMVACSACAKKNNAYNKTGVCSACGASLPEPPRYW